MVPKETLSRKFLWGYRVLSLPDFRSSCVCCCCCCCLELLDLSFPVRPECEGSNFSCLRWRVSTSLILKSVGYCFSPWPGHTVFTSTSCHILLNLNLPLSSPFLLHDSERHISALPWGGVKGSRREPADPRAQLLAPAGLTSTRGRSSSSRETPPHPQSRHWEEWQDLPLGSSFSERPQHKDLPVLRSEYSCDRGSQKSKQESAGALSASPHC